MDGKTHRKIGLLATAPLIMTGTVGIVEGLVAIAGSVAPDVDLEIKGLKHRTYTHSLLALSVTTLLALFWSEGFAIAWFVNYGLHIFADSFTVRGVGLLYPFDKKMYGAKIINTSKNKKRKRRY